MINIKSIQTDNENEIINFIGRVDSENSFFSVVIDRGVLTTEEKSIYDDVVGMLTDASDTTIINTLSEVMIDRMTSSTVSENTNDEIDYESLPTSDQNKLKAFMQLAITLNS